MPEPRRADGERGRQRDGLVGLAGERGEPRGDVHVGRGQHADVVELAQQPGRADRAADVERVDHSASPASSTSLSATTNEAGGRHANTPDSGAPVIPRTNRYSTPARLRAGS